ncbi:hypothetical protein M3Y99_01914500 [Aphelenchoides fujianensis]|nr:hypothetical protein M3Y99_01914500 [Aphelenchoides fujianensis]
MQTNRRANAEYFVVHILMPLENGDPDFKAALQRNADFYVPLIFRFCGRAMTDLKRHSRTALLKRVVAGLEKNGIALSLPSVNAMLETRLQNDDNFDPLEMLRKFEQDDGVVPDLRFFNCLAWQFAKFGQFREFDELVYEMKKRGISPDAETDRAKIFCSERSGVPLRSDSLIQRYAELHGKRRHGEALGAACCGAAAGKYLSRVRVLLRKAVRKGPNDERYVLQIPLQDLFDVVFHLSEKSVDGLGKEHVAVVQEILEHANHPTGFFKWLFSEAERHMNHNYFYSSMAIIGDMARVNEPLASQRKGTFNLHLMGRIAHRMVAAHLEKEVMVELSNRAAALFGTDIRFYDNVVFAILTHRHTTPMQKFEQFRAFADMIDPERERIHIILPLITSCKDPYDRCKMLYRCTNLGYTNVSDLSPTVLAKQILVPLFELFLSRYPHISDVQRLQKVADVIASYGVPARDVWLMYFYMLRESRQDKLNIVVSDENMAKWLKERKTACFPDPNPAAQQKLEAMTYAQLRNLVLNEKNAEKTHHFLLQRGFPPHTNFEEITEPLLYLYLEFANWGYVQKLLQMLSQREPKNYHLLRVLKRKLSELPPDSAMTPVLDLAYELKRKFPSAKATSLTFFDTIHEYRVLFRALLAPPRNPLETLPLKRYQTSIELLSILVRLQVINLHNNEILTPFIVHQVLKGLGWGEAVNCWQNFQSSFYTSNGMIELLRYALRNNDAQKIRFVLHKAQMIVSESRANAIFAAACLLERNQQRAEAIFGKKETPIHSRDVSAVFRFTNAWVVTTTFGSRHLDNHAMFPYDFMQLSLKYTDLLSDPKALEICHKDWIRHCEKRSLGQLALKFAELFESHGVDIGEENLRRVHALLLQHNQVVDHWISAEDSGLLNMETLKELDVMRAIERRREKVEQIGASLRSLGPRGEADSGQPVAGRVGSS